MRREEDDLSRVWERGQVAKWWSKYNTTLAMIAFVLLFFAINWIINSAWFSKWLLLSPTVKSLVRQLSAVPIAIVFIIILRIHSKRRAKAIELEIKGLVCRHCGYERSDDEKSCPECGSSHSW